MTAIAACHCGPCARGDGDPDMRALHADRHAIFATLMGERPDWHGFTPPSPRRIVELAAQEWDAPPVALLPARATGVCSVGTIAHRAGH